MWSDRAFDSMAEPAASDCLRRQLPAGSSPMHLDRARSRGTSPHPSVEHGHRGPRCGTRGNGSPRCPAPPFRERTPCSCADGIGQVSAPERITRGDRVVASLQFLADGVPPMALQVLLAHDFEWPPSSFPCTATRFSRAQAMNCQPLRPPPTGWHRRGQVSRPGWSVAEALAPKRPVRRVLGL